MTTVMLFLITTGCFVITAGCDPKTDHDESNVSPPEIPDLFGGPTIHPENRPMFHEVGGRDLPRWAVIPRIVDGADNMVLVDQPLNLLVVLLDVVHSSTEGASRVHSTGVVDATSQGVTIRWSKPPEHGEVHISRLDNVLLVVGREGSRRTHSLEEGAASVLYLQYDHATWRGFSTLFHFIVSSTEFSEDLRAFAAEFLD